MILGVLIYTFCWSCKARCAHPCRRELYTLWHIPPPPPYTHGTHKHKHITYHTHTHTTITNTITNTIHTNTNISTHTHTQRVRLTGVCGARAACTMTSPCWSREYGSGAFSIMAMSFVRGSLLFCHQHGQTWVTLRIPDSIVNYSSCADLSSRSNGEFPLTVQVSGTSVIRRQWSLRC